MVTWLLLIVLWTLAIIFYIQLPDRIPSHFNAEGAVDDYSDRTMLFLLTLIATAVVILLTFLNRYPHKFNYLVKISEENAAYQYRNALLMISVVKLTTVLIFSVVVILIYLNGSGKIDEPGPGLMISLVILPQIALFYILYRSVKKA